MRKTSTLPIEGEKLPLQGKKLRLRDWILEDLESYQKWQSPGNEWQRLDGPY